MHRAFLMTAAVGCATIMVLPKTTALAARSEQPRRPNFVVIFTDNQGYADVGCYGAEGFETPNIDRMAKQGMRFTDGRARQGSGDHNRSDLRRQAPRPRDVAED